MNGWGSTCMIMEAGFERQSSIRSSAVLDVFLSSIFAWTFSFEKCPAVRCSNNKLIPLHFTVAAITPMITGNCWMQKLHSIQQKLHSLFVSFYVLINGFKSRRFSSPAPCTPFELDSKQTPTLRKCSVGTFFVLENKQFGVKSPIHWWESRMEAPA